MALLQRPEVLLMFEDVMVYGFQQTGLPLIQDEDQVGARRLFTPSIGAAVLRFRCANERDYISNVRKETVELLLEPSSRRIGEFARTQVDNIFANGEPNYMSFFRYLAFILDLTIFAHRYKKIHLMNDVFVERGNVFDTFLATERELPFWRNFMALCDLVLRNSPEHGRPTTHFRNPALRWDPRDPTFNPDDPALPWNLPHLRLGRNHPILNPDRQALMNKIRRDCAAASKSAAENSDEGDESCNLGAESLNIGSANSKRVAGNSSISTGTENLNVETVNPILDDGNSSCDVVSSSTGAENLNSDKNSNSRNENSHPGAESSDLPALNSDPHPFDMIVSAMCWNIHDITLDPDPQDSSLD